MVIQFGITTKKMGQSHQNQQRNVGLEKMIYFNIQFASDIDFKEVIESHSPLKVIVENS